MSINTKFLIYHDLIGFNVQVKLTSRSSNQAFSDVGMIIDESKNMMVIKCNEKIKKYIKKDSVFRILVPEQDEIKTLEINGKKIIGRPENRIRNLKKKKWLRSYYE